jgi:hypothetical protein
VVLPQSSEEWSEYVSSSFRPNRNPACTPDFGGARQIVKTARRSWIRKLIDLSRRNNLLYFRPLKTGPLELTSASSERPRDLLVGESVSAAKVAPES